MNWDRALTAVVAVCCLVAVGTAAATMDASVSTDPAEAVDLDVTELPLGTTDEVGDLRRQVSADSRDAGSGGQEPGERSQSAGDGDAAASKSRPGDGGEPQPAQSRPDPEAQSQSSAGGDDRQRGSGPAEASESLLDRILDLLRSLLGVLLLLAGLVAAGVAASLLRDRLAGAFDRDGGESADRGPAVGEPAPQNEVSRAWYEMVERLGLADRYDLTPGEHADRAADRGVDPEVASSLTRLFEEVRYGDAPVTDERRRRARERVEEIRAQARRLRTEGGTGR
jgi:hypothetical protein